MTRIPAYRILRPDDAEALAGLHAEAFDTPWSAASFRQTLSTQTAHGLGHCANDLPDALDAFILLQRIDGEAEILALATASAVQRMGLAQNLIRTASRNLAARGAERLLLEVAADNAPALGLYDGLGFSQDGRRKAYYKRLDSPHADAILMSCDIKKLI